MEPKEKQVLEQNQEKTSGSVTSASLFVKVGIVVLSIIMIVGFGIKIIPDAVTVSNLSSKNDLPIYCVDSDEPRVAISFDATLGSEDTKKILTILEKQNVKATFFVTGEWVSKYPDDVKAIAAAGHDLGNHSENHMQMSQLSKEECVAEIMKMHNRVKELIGADMNLFRAPYGDYNSTLIGAARECGYYTIQWDIDSQDWRDYGVDGIINMTVNNKKLGNGSIILMHTGVKFTPEALDAVITGILEKDYKIVPVSQMIYTGEFTIDHTGRQFEK